MKAKLVGLGCVAACLLFVVASAARAEIHIEPIPTTPLFPGGGSLELYFPEEFHPEMPKILTFEGSIQNTSFTTPATILFWFDWIDPLNGPTIGTPHVFTLGVVGSGSNFQFFGGGPGEIPLTETLPFCPERVSIHFINDTPVTPGGDGAPTFVTGTFTHECVPEPITFAIVSLTIVMAPLAQRVAKKFLAAA